MLSVRPYKGEILPHWRFRTPELAARVGGAISGLFLRLIGQGDFVGMDMARKFLQMGYTRARRYANHRSGRRVRPRRPDSPAARARPGEGRGRRDLPGGMGAGEGRPRIRAAHASASRVV